MKEPIRPLQFRDSFSKVIYYFFSRHNPQEFWMKVVFALKDLLDFQPKNAKKKRILGTEKIYLKLRVLRDRP